MEGFKTRTRIVAGDPIKVGERRFIPSVLVTTLEGGNGPFGAFSGVRMRPISVVEQGPEGNRWHAFPEPTRDALSRMAAIGLGVALVSTLIIILAHLTRRRA